MGHVSNVFCYLFVKYRDICIYPSFFTLTKLSLDVYEEPHVYVNLVDFIEIYITCLWKLPFPVITCWRLKEPTTVDHTELGRSKIVLPRDWSEEPNKTSWNIAVLPLLHLLHQKSPSSKSRIRVYLLLVDRDPTTTTHRAHQRNIFVKEVLIFHFQTNQRSTIAISVESTFQAFGYTTNAKSASTSLFAKSVTVKRGINTRWLLWEIFVKVV
jgi:hypothetical protein